MAQAVRRLRQLGQCIILICAPWGGRDDGRCGCGAGVVDSRCPTRMWALGAWRTFGVLAVIVSPPWHG